MKNHSQLMPVLFLAHGSPMNAIANNNYTQMLVKLGATLPTPKAILMISAHWVTPGTTVTHMAKPKTIHDFGRFPQELFAIQYPAPGSPELAEMIHSMIQQPKIKLDDTQWGLDHGAWSVLRHLYPKADIPVAQLSLDLSQSPKSHLELGQKLHTLREQDILILGSGNIVHNLRKISWEENAPPMSWAVDFDERTKEKINARDIEALLSDQSERDEHYTPLLYILGASLPGEPIQHVFEGIQNGSISMRCIQFG